MLRFDFRLTIKTAFLEQLREKIPPVVIYPISKHKFLLSWATDAIVLTSVALLRLVERVSTSKEVDHSIKTTPKTEHEHERQQTFYSPDQQ